MKAPIEDKDITSLYQSDASEVPSSELDENILNYAKSQTAKKRNWWPQIGLAASVVFVAILAPWTWLEEVPVMEGDGTSYLVKPEKVMSDSVRERAVLRSEPKSNSKQSSMKAAPMVVQTEEALVPELASNPFEEIEALLKAGNKKQAQQRLERLLRESPELEKQLPDELKTLITEPAVE